MECWDNLEEEVIFSCVVRRDKGGICIWFWKWIGFVCMWRSRGGVLGWGNGASKSWGGKKYRRSLVGWEYWIELNLGFFGFRDRVYYLLLVRVEWGLFGVEVSDDGWLGIVCLGIRM